MQQRQTWRDIQKMNKRARRNEFFLEVAALTSAMVITIVVIMTIWMLIF